MTRYILGIDPGLATGLCLIDTSEPTNPRLVWSEEVDMLKFYELVPDTLDKYQGEISVVCENFLISVSTAKKSPAPWSLELIGLSRYLCTIRDIPFIVQNPNEREISTHPMIKHFGLWHRGGEGHANQAIRHCFAYLLKQSRGLAKIALNV